MSELITVQGTARSGKGTMSQGLAEYLRQSHTAKVAVIDTGLKFRVVTHEFQAINGDFDDPQAIDAYLQQDSFRDRMLETFATIQKMTADERENIYHSAAVSARVARIGQSAVAHQVIGELLDDEIELAVDQNDVTIVDGRALYERGLMTERRLPDVRYLVGIDTICSPMVAAERVLRKRLKRQPHTNEIAVEAETINLRNQTDRERTVQPMLPIPGAHWLDLCNRHLDIDREATVLNSIGTRAVWLDNSFTTTPEQLITPVAKLVDRLMA